ncbi:MAG: hypothetical protein KAU02_02170 [Tenericutes bacterium]|nr:hypothetical protein [Mycoplasmatota bacterium]
MEKIVNILRKYTLKNIFIDGAFFRHSLAKISEATIFVVGANLTNNIDKVIDYAALTSKKFKLEKADNKLEKLAEHTNVCFVNEHNQIRDLGFDSIIGNTEKIFMEDNKKYRYLYLPKSLSNDFLLKLVEHRRDYKFDIVLNSPVSIQLNLDNLNNLFKLKNKVLVMNSINLVAICLNPVSSRGYEFNKKEFKEKLENILGVEVFNVLEEVTYE